MHKHGVLLIVIYVLSVTNLEVYGTYLAQFAQLDGNLSSYNYNMQKYMEQVRSSKIISLIDFHVIRIRMHWGHYENRYKIGGHNIMYLLE
jgi:hypothetical protein